MKILNTGEYHLVQMTDHEYEALSHLREAVGDDWLPFLHALHAVLQSGFGMKTRGFTITIDTERKVTVEGLDGR
jgi:hypothetical protein